MISTCPVALNSLMQRRTATERSTTECPSLAVAAAAAVPPCTHTLPNCCVLCMGRQWWLCTPLANLIISSCRALFRLFPFRYLSRAILTHAPALLSTLHSNPLRHSTSLSLSFSSTVLCAPPQSYCNHLALAVVLPPPTLPPPPPPLQSPIVAS